MPISQNASHRSNLNSPRKGDAAALRDFSSGELLAILEFLNYYGERALDNAAYFRKNSPKPTPFVLQGQLDHWTQTAAACRSLAMIAAKILPVT